VLGVGTSGMEFSRPFDLSSKAVVTIDSHPPFGVVSRNAENNLPRKPHIKRTRQAKLDTSFLFSLNQAERPPCPKLLRT